MRYLLWIFYLLAITGVIFYTLRFIGIGQELFDTYFHWIRASLWIGIIGIFIVERFTKTKR